MRAVVSLRRVVVVAILVAGSVACPAATATANDRTTADLRVRLAALPTETRPGGSVTYSVALANAGSRPARGVELTIAGDAQVLSVTARGIACVVESDFAVRCSAAVLRPGARARVEVAALAGAVGTSRVAATAASATRDATARDNRATATIAVRPPDSVQVAASRYFTGTELPQNLTIDAISAANGEDPAGTFSLTGRGEQLSGRVTCVRVSGNRATVGVSIDHSNTPPVPGATPTSWLVFFLVDNGSPGVGRDTFTYGGGGGGGPLTPCLFPGQVVGFPLTAGEITILDTP